MGKRKRTDNQYERRAMAANTGLELLQHQRAHPDSEQSQVTTHDTIRTHPFSPKGRATTAIIAHDAGSVHTDLQTHQTSSFFPTSTGFEVSGGQFNSYRDNNSTGNVFINFQSPSGNEEFLEVRRSVPGVPRRQQRNIQTSRSFAQDNGDSNFSLDGEVSNPQFLVAEQHLSAPTSRTTARSPSPPRPVQKSSEIYYRHLLTSGRGSPLWIPEPSNTLPIEYQRAGIGIGDAIILTDSGGTDFLFNIYEPRGDSEHSINLPTMPEEYYPLDRPHNRDMSSHVEFKNNSFLASSLVDSRQDEESAALIFESSAIDGAILTMPNGANSTDLKNKTIFRKYVRLNAERWYRYANEVCGRDARNGDIRLVVGKTSTTIWGMATFANRSEQSTFRLKFKPTGNGGNGMGQARYGWECSGMVEVKSGPDSHEVEKLRGDDEDGKDSGQLKAYENQCLFVRTINVTLQDDVWNKLMMEWERLDLDEDKSSGSNSDNGLGSGGSRFSFGSSNSGKSSDSSGINPSGSKTDTRAMSDGTTRGTLSINEIEGGLHQSSRPKHLKRSVHLSSFPPPIDLHPSKIIHRFLLKERPHAKMAITEDEDWISVLDKNEKVLPTPDILISRVMAMYEINDEEDVVFLKIRDLPSVPMMTRPLASSATKTLDRSPTADFLRGVGKRHYYLEVVQHPIRARMCGFGDKDRRPLAPAAVAKMIVRREDDSIVDVDDVDTTFFLVTVDLWSGDGKQEMNLVLHPSSADHHASFSMSSSKKHRGASDSVLSARQSGNQRPGGQTTPTPSQYRPGDQILNSTSFLRASLSAHAPSRNQSQQVGLPLRATSTTTTEALEASRWSQQFDTFKPSSSNTETEQSVYGRAPYTQGQHGPFTQFPPPTNSPGSSHTPGTGGSDLPPQHTYTRTLVGPLSANACRLLDERRKPGIFFIFPDLSVRTEGSFRLRMRLMNVGAPPALEMGAQGVHNDVSPVLYETFTEPFTVYSAKRFPGVPDTTALSIAFGNQGEKLPLRIQHGSSKRRRDGPESDDDSDT